MVLISVNSIEFEVNEEISILEACELAGFKVPRFCYHEILSISGNCRMCLVELEDVDKPVASCVTEVEDNMKIWIDSPFVQKARENVLEFLLLNHPLDCPICDQAGECDLQDQTKIFSSDYSRFFFNKRGVEDKSLSVLIKTVMTRCIHCTRCVRFAEEIAGVNVLGTFNRGVSTEIGSYVKNIFNSEISGNVIDLCPVGALTSKPYTYKSRPWELRVFESIDLTDSFGANIYVSFKETEIYRVLPKNVIELNHNLITDKARYSYDGLKKNRLQHPFEYDTFRKIFKKSSWPEALDLCDFTLKEKRTNIVVNNEICVDDLCIIKSINYFHGSKLKVFQTEYKLYTNFYQTNNIDYTKILSLDIDICFLLSTSLKLENSILNYKIRHKFMRNVFKFYNFGYNAISNFSYNYVNFNLSLLLEIFEGKKNNLSKNLLKSKNPLILIGKSINSRIPMFDVYLENLKTNFSQFLIINVGLFCNEKGAQLLNMKSYSKKLKLLLVNNIYANLEDNIFIRKNIISKSKNFWLNSHGSAIAAKSLIVLPTLNYFEYEGHYINFEGTVQKSCNFINTFYNARRVKDILLSIYCYKKITNIYIKYLFSSITINQQGTNDICDNQLIFEITGNDYGFYSLYPFKNYILDFYCMNNLTKNSDLMLENSKQTRNIFSNF